MATIIPQGFMEKAIEAEIRARVETAISKAVADATKQIDKAIRDDIGQIVLGIASHYSVQYREREVVITVKNEVGKR